MDITNEKVLDALRTMYSGSSQEEKRAAMSYLEKFQKSNEAWNISHKILCSTDDEITAKMFAANTLRAKVHYDLSQIPGNDREGLKVTLMELLGTFFHRQERVIRIQLSIALVYLSLQYQDWVDPVGDIIARFSQSLDYVPCLLEYLKILPEELSELNRTSLTDDEYNNRCNELITKKVESVLLVLKNLIENANLDSMRPLVLDCLNSWIKESPVEGILNINTFTDLIFQSLALPDAFDAAIECLCTIVRETKDIENHELIDALFKQLLNINEFASSKGMLSDPDIFASLARLYVEAGESWHVLIAKNPTHFMPLVQILLECTKYEEDLDVSKYAFYFWYLLKQMICLEKYHASREAFKDIYSALITVIIKHLRYPIVDGDSDDLFEGDREQEDKFKEFRYEMGDVLKDCCAVVGATSALSIPLGIIHNIIAESSKNFKWQSVEAPLFSMRAMAREVPVKEGSIMPNVMQVLIQLPEHPKIRYATTLVLGRYSLWTSNNPQYLQPQLNYIIKGFEIYNAQSANDILKAAAHSLMFFCEDCAPLLVDYLEQLYLLYEQVREQIDSTSLYELAEGLAYVVKRVPPKNISEACEIFWKPAINVMQQALNLDPKDGSGCKYLCDQIEIITIFLSIIKCESFDAPSNLVCDLFTKNVWPLLMELSIRLSGSSEVSERLLSMLRHAIKAFSTYLLPILAQIAQFLHDGYKRTHNSTYLWVSASVLREFGDEYTSKEVKEATFQFGVSQCNQFFEYFDNEYSLKDIPDMLENFFNMADDLMMYFPIQFFQNEIIKKIMDASLRTLSLSDQFEPISSCLYFQLDLVSWGNHNPPISVLQHTPEQVQQTVINLLQSYCGSNFIKVLLEGLIFRFPHDTRDDGIELLFKTLSIILDTPASMNRLYETASGLPNVDSKEVETLIKTLSVALPNKDARRVRLSLKGFIDWYSRKHISPRSNFH